MIRRPVATTNSSANSGSGARISPILPAPARNSSRPTVNYSTTPRLPGNVRVAGNPQVVPVTQGLARVISFPDNILAVFFSNPKSMDARAINARTIAVTGIAPGQSTLAVFTSRFANDVVGKANIYRIETTTAEGTRPAQLSLDQLSNQIESALRDPRVRSTVLRLPDGTLAARLSGTLRDPAEVQGAIATASFFVPRVISSLYADSDAPTLETVLSGVTQLTPVNQLQSDLRRLTGNAGLELVELPSGLAVRVDVDSEAEAEGVLRVLPSLGRPVTPFIRVRGLEASGNPYYNSEVPFLQGEDLQLTQKLQSVTGIRTVYMVRLSGNSIAAYGSVRTRGEYEQVRRYANAAAQLAVATVQGYAQGGGTLRPQGLEGPILPAYDPAAGYLRDLGVQMFVRILDPQQQSVRNVNVETSIVEISRNSLKNLGIEVGSATTTEENRTSTPVLDSGGNPIFDAGGNQLFNTTLTREINPAFNPGSILAGDSFIGGGPFSLIDPFRARLNALATRGNARILARPNVRAVEGSQAQITIGGERPVPVAVASNEGVGQSVEFRRFGVILTMRPTVTDDNLILLQIRADVTQPDRTFEINLGGALIPGESVRSVDTTLTVRPGESIVLGGLMTNDKRQATSKVPILGDIPILGALFRSKRFENNETELAIFMTPRLENFPTTTPSLEQINRHPSYPALTGRSESLDFIGAGRQGAGAGAAR